MAESVEIIANTIFVPAKNVGALYRVIDDLQRDVPAIYHPTLVELLPAKLYWTCARNRGGDLYDFYPMKQAGDPVDWWSVLGWIAPYAYERGALVFMDRFQHIERFLVCSGGIVDWQKVRWESEIHKDKPEREN